MHTYELRIINLIVVLFLNNDIIMTGFERGGPMLHNSIDRGTEIGRS